MQARNLWGSISSCIHVHPVNCVSVDQYFVKMKINENHPSDLLTCKHLVFPKHTLNNSFIKFHHVISAHGQCWSITGHAAMFVNMLTTRNTSLNFYLISFNSRVSYHFPCNIPFQWYAGELGSVDMFIHYCRLEIESLGDRLTDTRVLGITF